MSLSFEKVDDIFRENFHLSVKISEINNHIRHSYYYEDRYIYRNKSEVAREVTQLMNGGVGGYIYVGHLAEYDNHPKRHKDGYLNIGHIEEKEFVDVTTKATKEYNRK